MSVRKRFTLFPSQISLTISLLGRRLGHFTDTNNMPTMGYARCLVSSRVC